MTLLTMQEVSVRNRSQRHDLEGRASGPVASLISLHLETTVAAVRLDEGFTQLARNQDHRWRRIASRRLYLSERADCRLEHLPYFGAQVRDSIIVFVLEEAGELVPHEPQNTRWVSDSVVWKTELTIRVA